MRRGIIGMDLRPDKIDLGEIVILPEFQSHGLGSAILNELKGRSESARVPIRLRVLRENRAASLHWRFGFEERGQTSTHFLLEFVPKAK